MLQMLVLVFNKINKVLLFYYKFFDPLEQFDIIKFLNFNNVVLWSYIILFFVFCFFYTLYLKNEFNFYYLLKFIYNFIFNIVTSRIENRWVSLRYIPIFLFLFLFLLISNIVGTISFTYTITSLLLLPFFLSITFFVGIILISIRKHKWIFFSGFLPSGVPSFIMPFLVLIEFISYIMRIFSLAIRLFANMLSGHILIKILVSVSWFLINSFLVIQTFFSLVIVILILTIFLLEMIICLLQAYVFVSLCSMYLNESLKFGVH